MRKRPGNWEATARPSRPTLLSAPLFFPSPEPQIHHPRPQSRRPTLVPQIHDQTLAAATRPRSGAADHGRAMALQPELIDDAIAEVLLRLPPDEPKHLFRASLVCKTWLRIITDPVFPRRYRAFHGAPPLLGLLHRFGNSSYGDPEPCFTPVTAVPAFPSPDFDGLEADALDCRHGRVLIHMVGDRDEDPDLLVWDPVTGDRHCIPMPDMDCMESSVTVFCAATGCHHLDCHGGPFGVAFLLEGFNDADGGVESSPGLWAMVYSSETCAWSEPIRASDVSIDRKLGRPTLIGDEIYFALVTTTVDNVVTIVKYDWRKNCLSPCNPQPPESYKRWISLMVMEDSSLGLAGIEDSRLHMWKRNVIAEGAAEWVQCRVIELETMVPMAGNGNWAHVVGFAEDVGIIFVKTSAGLFMIKLKSGHVRKVGEPGDYFTALPYMSFCTPGSKAMIL
ncbi:hypothetical protein EJB05_14316, partial [Eragrostis curvula]